MTSETKDRAYVPALGQHWMTPFYDSAIALTTREATWRTALIGLVDPHGEDVILDIGCGTGSLIAAMKAASPETQIIGLDPDPEVLEIAKAKARSRGHKVEFVQGFGDELLEKVGNRPINKIVSSLVFHQVPLDGKRSTLQATFDLLPEDGELFIADFGEQRTPLMRFLFKTVQRLDGYEFTQPNADGCLPVILTDVGFSAVQEALVVPTIVGSISLYSAQKGGM